MELRLVWDGPREICAWGENGTMGIHGETAVVAEKRGQLGTVICARCGEVIDTLPTNGVKTMYGLCNEADCRVRKGADEGDTR